MPLSTIHLGTPAFLPALAVGLGFLFLLSLLAIALVRALRGRGERGPGAVGTLFLAGGLGFLGLLAFGVFLVMVALFGVVSVIEHGPVRSIEIVRTDAAGTVHAADTRTLVRETGAIEDQAREAYQRGTADLDKRYPLHVIVKVRGKIDVPRLAHWLERESGGDVDVVETSRIHEGGQDLTRIDFGIEVDPDDLAELEREFESGQPFFDLPEGLRIVVREP